MLTHRLDDADRVAWREQHRLHLALPFSPPQLAKIVASTDEVEAWPEEPGRSMKYFEAGAGTGSSGDARQLCRVENFLPYHAGLRALLLCDGLSQILAGLMAEPAVLFKEKINYKLPGGGGFEAHQDAPAFAAFGQRYHVTLLLAIDAQTTENGCLEFSTPRPVNDLLSQRAGGAIASEVEAAMAWVPLELDAGDVVFFDSYLPHRSAPNRSNAPRRALYVTYNRASDGDHRADYYAAKRAAFPPECEREPGVDYSESESLYNLGNPIR